MKRLNKISIVTPTYNRCNTLSKCYESLRNQSVLDFEWIIIDDGSTDNTREYISKIKEHEKNITICYVYKDNGGKHTALNTSHEYINTELVFVLDSDDILTSNCIEKILSDWEIYRHNSDICGMCYLIGFDAKSVIGHPFPSSPCISNHIKMRINGNADGDKAEVVRADLFKEINYPVFDEEKFLGEGYLWLTLSKKYDTVYINEIIYIAEYLEGGLSKLGRKLRIHCPKGGMFNSSLFLDSSFSTVVRIKKALLYNVYGFFAGLKPWQYLPSRNKAPVIICIPLGYAIYVFWKFKYDRKT